MMSGGLEPDEGALVAAVAKSDRASFERLYALYERRVHLIVAAQDIPDRLFAAGFGAEDFRRTSSRLMEMQTQEYLAQPQLR